MRNPGMILWWEKYLQAKLSARLAANFSMDRPFGDRRRDEELAQFPVAESEWVGTDHLITACEFAEWYAMQVLEIYKKSQQRGCDGGLNMATADEHYNFGHRLDCGRSVTVEECYISTSMLGYLAGSPENPRVIRHVVDHLPERVQGQLGESTPHYIKPLPEGTSLPRFVFMVYLVSEPISDQEASPRVMDPISGQAVRHYDGSKLILLAV